MENDELLSDFLEESFDLVEKVKEALLRWKGSDKKEDLVNDIYRWVHTIKGGCSVFGFSETTKIAHALETRLGDFRSNVDAINDRELSLITQEIAAIEEKLKKGDASSIEEVQAAPEATSCSFNTKFFSAFYENSSDLLNDMYRDGFTFFEIEVPETISDRVKNKLADHGLVALEEISDGGKMLFLMFTNLNENPGHKELIDGLLTKFNGQYCFRSEESLTEETMEPVPEASVTSSPALTSSGEVLRVPLGSVNSVLDHIWELFLLHNQLSHLMKMNSHLFKENHSFIQQFDTLEAMAERTIQELESKTMSMRTGPIKKVFDRMTKVVEDYSRQSGKKIKFITCGEGIDLDKKVLDALSEPLIHLIRNAIDHGLESERDRHAAGKSEIGSVELAAMVSGNEVNITITDDGKGIDSNKILETAKKKNLETGHLKTEQEIIGLIFEPGFSTAEKVSNVSGRGVGMDAVKKSIHELGGEISIQTKVSEGTVFKITLPLSMSVSKSLVVKVRDLQYAFSTKSIFFVEKISVHELKRNDKDEYFVFNEKLIPCYDLGLILPDYRRHPDIPETHTHICVISYQGQEVAFRVDEIVQTLNVVMKPVPRLIPKNSILSGVSILPDGNPIFVLNVFEAITKIKEKANGGAHGQQVA